MVKKKTSLGEGIKAIYELSLELNEDLIAKYNAKMEREKNEYRREQARRELVRKIHGDDLPELSAGEWDEMFDPVRGSKTSLLALRKQVFKKWPDEPALVDMIYAYALSRGWIWKTSSNNYYLIGWVLIGDWNGGKGWKQVLK